MHHLDCFVAKAKNHLTVLFLFCRKHTIQRSSRIWHLPSQVGNAYDSPHFGTKGFSRIVSFTLVLLWQHSVGGSETNRIWFLATFWDVTTVVTLFSICFLLMEVLNPHKKKSSYWGTFWLFTSSLFFWEVMHQTSWIIEIQFYFGLIPRFLCKSFLLCCIIIFHDFDQDFSVLKSCCKYLNSN